MASILAMSTVLASTKVMVQLWDMEEVVVVGLLVERVLTEVLELHRNQNLSQNIHSFQRNRIEGTALSGVRYGPLTGWLPDSDWG